jgi:NAD(P)H-hydrate epimerase
MKLVSVQEMRALERRAIDEYEIPALILMENAGRQIADRVRELLGTAADKQILLLVGRGGNGGDGLVAARHLLNAGARVQVFLCDSGGAMSPEAAANLRILEKMPARITVWDATSIKLLVLIQIILATDLIVDAIFGTGFQGETPELLHQLIQMANTRRCPLLAIDVPSGLSADDGRCAGVTIRADHTVALGLVKLGLVLDEAGPYVGQLQVADISLPQALLDSHSAQHTLTEAAEVRSALPPRVEDSHKRDYGLAVTIGGSAGMSGAIALASQAALRAGAGLVTCALPASLLPPLSAYPEIMFHPLPETLDRRLSMAAMPEIMALLADADAGVVGPGLARYLEAPALVEAIITQTPVPLVVDADALNALAGRGEIFQSSPQPLIITPHPGEMARLIVSTPDAVQQNRLALAVKYAVEWGVVLVLKGHRTVIATPQGKIFINPTGNAGMATAGSGDVLAGLIAGLLAQGLSAEQAAVSGVFLHGAAGDLAAAQTGQRALIAGDIIAALPQVLWQIEGR